MSKNDNKPTPEAPAVLPPQGAAASGPVEPVPRRLLDALVAAAQAVRANAHAPYSHFAVGAAVLDEQDRIHAGCNVENAAYPQGWCAEASALAVMVAAGGKRVHVVAVCAEGAEVVTLWRLPAEAARICGGWLRRLGGRHDRAARLVHTRRIAAAQFRPCAFAPAVKRCIPASLTP